MDLKKNKIKMISMSVCTEDCWVKYELYWMPFLYDSIIVSLIKSNILYLLEYNIIYFFGRCAY